MSDEHIKVTLGDDNPWDCQNGDWDDSQDEEDDDEGVGCMNQRQRTTPTSLKEQRLRSKTTRARSPNDEGFKYRRSVARDS